MGKKLIVSILLLTFMTGLLPIYAQETLQFTDVPPEHEAYEAISYLTQKGIIDGKNDKEFCPEDSLKREEFAKILTNAAALGSEGNAPIFLDVPAGTWYVPYVGAAALSKLMTGVSDSEFGTGLELSRQDMAVILQRMAERLKLQLEQSNTVLYADNDEIADYARGAVISITGVGVMNAAQDNRFAPQDAVCRGDAARAMYALLSFERTQNEALGRYSTSPTRWDGPFDVPTDDKLAENMPIPFDANKWPMTEILTEDFEDGDFGGLRQEVITERIELTENEGYNGTGGVKITDGGTLALSFSSNTLQPGDYLVLRCNMKGEDINGSGNYRGIVQIYDEENKWLTESSGGVNGLIRTSTDWHEEQFIVMIPEDLNALSKKTYTIKLNAYMHELTGKVYFDDFVLSTLLFEPMDTVLMTPNYKGLIYGEGGVGDISLRAYIGDRNGAYDLSKMDFTAKIVDEEDKVYKQSVSEAITPVMDVYFSSGDLEMDKDYYLECYLTERATGRNIQKQSWTLRKRKEDYRPKIYIDEYGRLVKEGTPFFPISIFHYDYSEDGGFNLEATIGKDVDTLHSNGMRPWYTFGTSPSFQRDMKILEENGKGYVLSTGPFYYSSMIYPEVSDHVKQQSDVRGYLGRVVDYFKDLPNLEMYYTQDERNAVRFGEELRWQNEIIADHDLDHPTFGAICEKIDNRPGVWAKVNDILVTDPYPVTGMDNQNLHEVTDFVSYLRDSNPNRPVGVILQGFFFRDRKNVGGPDLRGPTQQEFRNMAFQAILAGSCMMNCYAYGHIERVTPASPGRTIEEEWNERQEVFSEITRFKPIILSALPAPYYELRGGGSWLTTMSKRYDGKSYLFAVNNQAQTKVARIKLDGVSEMTGMYSGEVYKADNGGWFEIMLDALQAEVFEYEQADYESPHAELKRFGLLSQGAGFMLLEADNEKPRFIISQNISTAEFNADISDYAKMYINEKSVETTGVVDISGLSELTVKIVSQDGRFNGEKTFILERN